MRAVKEAIERMTKAFKSFSLKVIKGRRVEVTDPGLNDTREHSWTSQTAEIILDFLNNNHSEFQFNPTGPVHEVMVRCSVASPVIRYRMAKRIGDGKWSPGSHEKHVFPILADSIKIFTGCFAEFSVQPASSATVYIKASKYNQDNDQWVEGS